MYVRQVLMQAVKYLMSCIKYLASDINIWGLASIFDVYNQNFIIENHRFGSKDKYLMVSFPKARWQGAVLFTFGSLGTLHWMDTFMTSKFDIAFQILTWDVKMT